MHSSNLKAKYGLQTQTYFLPLTSAFTLVNSELRNISNDQMTANVLIINMLSGHWPLVIFAFTLSFQYLA